MAEIVEIEGNDLLYRRVQQMHILPDRASSAAFKDKRHKPDEQASVDLARLTTPEESLARGKRSDLSLFGILAQEPTRLGLEVRHDPCPEEEPDNQAHTLIVGNDSMAKCRQLAEKLQMIIDARS